MSDIDFVILSSSDVVFLSRNQWCGGDGMLCFRWGYAWRDMKKEM